MNLIYRRIGKTRLVLAVFFILLATGIYAGKQYFAQNNQKEDVQEEKIAKQVKTLVIDTDSQNENAINIVGSVVPEAKIDIIALSRGTLRVVNFEIGNNVFTNQVLANMYSSSVLTSHTSTQINYTNMKNNLDSIERVADETIRQTEIGLQNSEESVRSAEIGLKTAEDTLENAGALREKTNLDTLDNAIISFDDYLNFIDSTLDSVNYIIKAEEGAQIAGISEVIAAKDAQSLNIAKRDYLETRQNYDELKLRESLRDSIIENMGLVVDLLSQTKVAVDDTVDVLDNTISSVNFSEDLLGAQRNNFSSIRSQVVSKKNGAEATLNSLENLSLVDISENDALENAVESAKNRLNLALLGRDNSKAALESAKAAKDQQLASARTSLDSAEGQLNLTKTQVADLTVKAPVSGKITGKFVEVGTEVNPGQKIAEVSKVDNVKVEVSLSSEDIYRIKLGQDVYLGEERLLAQITSINPVADPITRKVGIEILFNNKNNELIPGTFLDVEIPVEKLEKSDESSVYVPLRAVNITQNDSFVFVVIDGVAQKRQVKTKKTKGALIEIVEGLENGDELVIEGAKSLEGGEKVEIRE